MGDLEDEFAKFQAELATVEAEVQQAETQPEAAPQDDYDAEFARFQAGIAGISSKGQTDQQQLGEDLPPPVLPPPSRPPPSKSSIATSSAKPIIAAPAQVAAPPQKASSPPPPAIPPPPVAAAQAPGMAYATGTQVPQYITPPPTGPPGKKVAIVRSAAGEKWLDPKLAEWPENDYRIFVGNLGNEVNDTMLIQAFQHYPSFQMAKVIRNTKNNKSKGYGFVSLGDPADGVKALKEMNSKYIGNRPVQLKHSKWEKRNLTDKRGKPKKRVVDDRNAGYEPEAKRHQGILHR